MLYAMLQGLLFEVIVKVIALDVGKLESTGFSNEPQKSWTVLRSKFSE
jgi:hypothetical protein